MTRQRRGKRDKHALEPPPAVDQAVLPLQVLKKKRQSKSLQKHQNDGKSGGMEALLPSLIGVTILICGVLAKLGFRGRATVVGIDLGTTNSVICVQAQSTGTMRMVIDCIADPATGSPVIPSVVSFLDVAERKVGPTSKLPSLLHPHPSHVVVGQAAKTRIDSHPHHTLYNAKRVLGRSARDPAVHALAAEVEFRVVVPDDDSDDGVVFRVPDTDLPVTPGMVGSYVVHHLVRSVAQTVLGHDNFVRSAVICVPVQFNLRQRQATVDAFRNAGITVARILEEPTAAALAYGLHRKPNVDYILVYDFGGGTLDVSLLHVSDGFVDVMGSDGDDRLGGTDFDAAIAHYLLLLQPQPPQDDDNGGDGGKSNHHHHETAVARVASVLRQLEEAERLADLEDLLATQCPALSVTPLCTMTSFHTIGEQLKIKLSEAYHLDNNNREEETVVVSAECLGLPPDSSSSSIDNTLKWTVESFCASLQPVTLTLTSLEFSEIAQPLLDRSMVPASRLMADLDLTSSDIDEIVLVGGTTRMPQIRQLVQATFVHSQLNTHIDPDITVAYGAASVID